MRTSLLSIDAIRLDFQPSENLSEDIVDAYVDMLRRGDPVPSVRVPYDGTNYLLEDGFHRIEAVRRTGIKQTEAEIHPGTLAEMEAEFRRALRTALDMLKEERSSQRKADARGWLPKIRLRRKSLGHLQS